VLYLPKLVDHNTQQTANQLPHYIKISTVVYQGKEGAVQSAQPVFREGNWSPFPETMSVRAPETP